MFDISFFEGIKSIISKKVEETWKKLGKMRDLWLEIVLVLHCKSFYKEYDEQHILGKMFA